MATPNKYPLIASSLLAGGGGLEVRGDGAGQAVPVDIHDYVYRRLGTDSVPGAQPVRHDATHRYPVFKDCQEED